jgi:hypothetical protein
MPDFDDSTLWRVSAFERERVSTQGPGTTLLASTLMAELHALHRNDLADDVLQIFAVCVRLRESALVYLECERLVWPITLFPRDMLYHSPQSIAQCSETILANVRSMGVESAVVRAPGQWMHDRHAPTDAYHALPPALWKLALQGPSPQLLGEIGGTAAYRVLRNPQEDRLPTPGALGPAIASMRKEAMALRHLARLPGMSVERASRLLNALYLTSNLVVTRAHPSARPQAREPGLGRRST